MHAYLIAAMTLGGVPSITDGSVLVMENSNKVVMAYTDASVTHVAVVINVGDNPWVYEATPDQVRQVPLSSYLDELADLNRNRRRPTTLTLLRPERPYTSQQVQRMKRHLDAQLGRRYSVRGYVRKKPGDGVHCAQLVATTLKLTGRYTMPPSERISPDDLVARLATSHLPAKPIDVSPSQPDNSWCNRAYTSWFGFKTWCKWACYESWTFCW